MTTAPHQAPSATPTLTLATAASDSPKNPVADTTPHSPTGLVVLFDEPLHLHAPEHVRARLTNPQFLTLCKRERTLHAAHTALEAIPAADRDSRTWHRILDSWRAVRAEIAAYRLTTAHLLATHPHTPAPTAALVPPVGVNRVGQAQTASVEWLRLRQGTLGGSDVGAICKVGRYGAYDCERARASHLERNPQPQDHQGAALAGDLWEPILVDIVGRLTGRTVCTDKATYADATRHVNLDGYVPTADGHVAAVVEAKTSSHPNDWADGAPAAHILQTLHNADLLGAPEGLLIVNVNDERLKVYAVHADTTVEPGPKTPKKLGQQITYPAARAYAEHLVAKWTHERQFGPAPAPSPRQTRPEDPAFRIAWQAAHQRGLVFLDLETTTFAPSSGHIIELGAVRDDGAVLERVYDVPDDHHAWNGTGAVDVHGITRDLLTGHPTLIEDDTSVAEIAAFIGDRVVVAHNAPFESRFLTDTGLTLTYADTMRAFATVVADPAVPTNTLADLVAWAGVEYRDGHRALADAQMLHDAFDILGPLVWARLGAATAA